MGPRNMLAEAVVAFYGSRQEAPLTLPRSTRPNTETFIPRGTTSADLEQILTHSQQMAQGPKLPQQG